MSVRITRKTSPVFLAINIILVVSAAVLFVELPKGGVVNTEDLGYSINLYLAKAVGREPCRSRE
jgi:hypothetical protein